MSGVVDRGDPATLVDAALAGDRQALARVLSVIERGGADAQAVDRRCYPHTGVAYTVGLTGAPGAGKSTLTSALVGELRRDGSSVGVLAIDPSSPFSGGAILGDRVRMGTHALDLGVFIRSMATRGHLGGLALATPDAVRVLDAAGFGWVIVETVGVGQVEVEVARAADTTVVVVNPGWGDAVQANKAGLMEIADVFVINKADRPGASDTRRDLESMLDLRGDADWRPPVVCTTATSGAGADELDAALRAHRAHLGDGGRLEAKRAARLAAELRLVVEERVRADVAAALARPEGAALTEAVARRELDPYTAADRLLAGREPSA